MHRRTLLLLAFAVLIPRIGAASAEGLDALLGDQWFGLYMNGEKVGWAHHAVQREAEGGVSVMQNATFQVNMVGVKQDMRIETTRRYDPEGRLSGLDQVVVDVASTTTFSGRVEGGEFIVQSEIGGATVEKRYPRPSETLRDALRHAKWVREDPSLGDEVTYTLFEPMLEREITARSQLADSRIRVFDGVSTRTYKINTVIDVMNLENVSYVTEDGKTLEDEVAGMLTMRLEPKEIAQDVSYSNDTIVSNAAFVDRPIASPRTRSELRLILRGPLTASHLFNDERQFLQAKDDHFLFVSRQVSLDDVTPAELPVADPDMQQWLAPSTFVQSDHPRLVAQAREIIGDERDSLEAARLLCNWVYENVRSTYSARLSNALEVLDNREGDCTEHSVLFVGLARAAGLPAREIAGLVYVEGPQPGFYFHQWAKVWVGKWIEVDPTFNQPIADVARIKLAEGDLFQQAKIIPLIGHVEVELAPETAGAASEAS